MQKLSFNINTLFNHTIPAHISQVNA